jgi:hypothetical protein
MPPHMRLQKAGSLDNIYTGNDEIDLPQLKYGGLTGKKGHKYG